MILFNTIFYGIMLLTFTMVDYFELQSSWLVLFYFIFSVCVKSVPKIFLNRWVDFILAIIFTIFSILYLNTIQSISFNDAFIVFFVCYLPLLQLGESIRYKSN